MLAGFLVGGIFDLGFDDGFERPVFAPGGAFVDPAPNERDFFFGYFASEFWRRHFVVGVIGGQPVENLAGVRVAGFDRMVGLVALATFAFGIGFVVEAQIAFASLVWIEAVALKAVVGQDGQDVAREVHRLGGVRGGGDQHGCEAEDYWGRAEFHSLGKAWQGMCTVIFTYDSTNYFLGAVCEKMASLPNRLEGVA